MKVERISALRALEPRVSLPSRPPRSEPAPAEDGRFAGERGKSEQALRQALERGVGAAHKREHSARFGALLDEEA